jgi:uncharacterized membrane protein YhaH (DUF805 family)
MSFDATFANPAGRISRGRFIPALIVLLAVAAFYFFLVKAGRNGDWVLVTLLFPGVVLHARRLHDMGLTAWLLLIPLVPTLVAVWLHLYEKGSQLQTPASLAAAVLCVGFIVWGLFGSGQTAANRFGDATE